MEGFVRELGSHPIIAAVRDIEGVRHAVMSAAPAIFLLGGSINSLPLMVAEAKDSGKRIFVHLDLMDGLGRDAAAVEWCARNLRPDGLISTRAPMLKQASEFGMITIQRLFVMDKSSLVHGIKMLKGAKADVIEVLPGLVPKAIVQLKEALPQAVIIAGGLVTEMDEVYGALGAGALGVSTSEASLWGADVL